MAVAQYFTWMYAPIERTMGHLQKIFYTHMPMAWWSLISFFIVFLASIGYLVKRGRRFDLVAGAAAEVGMVFATLALITGSIWARGAWNVWWTWDPRLTTSLIMWYVYAAYLVLRSVPMNPARRELFCAVLGVVAFLDVPLVFYSARLWGGAHPVVIREGGGMEPEMWTTLAVNLAAWGIMWSAITLYRYRQIRLNDKVNALAASKIM